MDVIVETQCSRCRKKSEERIPLEKAQEMEQCANTRINAQAELSGKIQELLKNAGSNGPELLIAQATADGYSVQILNEMCHTPAAKRNKGCVPRVEFLVKEIFMQNPAPPKSKPKSKGKENKGKDDKGKNNGKNEGGKQ